MYIGRRYKRLRYIDARHTKMSVQFFANNSLIIASATMKL